jgi:hypothetical protein
MRLAVIGSKEFTDYNKLKATLDREEEIALIVSGGAPGTDTLAKRYAKENGIKFLEFLPEYDKYGSEAKHARDRQIVENCDRIIAFWDSECEGTKYTMNYGRKLNKPIKIIELYPISFYRQ